MSGHAIRNMRNAGMDDVQICYCLMEIYSASMFVERQRMELFQRTPIPTLLEMKELLEEWAKE